MSQYPANVQRELTATERNHPQGYGPYQPIQASVRLSDEDVDRIARAVVRLLREEPQR